MNREVICADSLIWLQNCGKYPAIITSLPDMEEIGANYDDWVAWVRNISFWLSRALEDDGVIIFYQTDRKYNGTIIDKKTLISNEFVNVMGFKCVYSKIVLKQEVNTSNIFRPGFTNLFGFSRKKGSGKVTPDVFPAGKMIYKNAMGFDACSAAIKFIKEKTKSKIILDPFCGQGSVLKIANELGLDAIGVEILEEQCEKARG